MEALGINIGYLIMQILGIIVLMSILIHFAYNPILRVLEERKERIAKGLEDARQAAIARDNADAEAKKIMEAARAEAAKLRQDAAEQAEVSAKNIIAEANEEAKKIIAEAREEAEEERNNVLGGLRSQVAAISIAAANKIIKDSLDEKRQRELISEFFSKVPQNVSGASAEKAEVTSALPLTDEERSKIEKSINAEKINYKVNPNILGGLIIRIDDQVVDNSVSSRMAGLASSLK